MDTRAMSKVKMGYEALDASSSHQEPVMLMTDGATSHGNGNGC